MLKPAEVAELLRTTEKTLANWRSRGQGPAYVRVETSVLYRRSAVEGYLAARTVAAR